MDWVFSMVFDCVLNSCRGCQMVLFCPYGVACGSRIFAAEAGTRKECDHTGVSEAIWVLAKEMVRCIKLAKSTVAKGNGR